MVCGEKKIKRCRWRERVEARARARDALVLVYLRKERRRRRRRRKRRHMRGTENGEMKRKKKAKKRGKKGKKGERARSTHTHTHTHTYIHIYAQRESTARGIGGIVETRCSAFENEFKHAEARVAEVSGSVNFGDKFHQVHSGTAYARVHVRAHTRSGVSRCSSANSGERCTKRRFVRESPFRFVAFDSIPRSIEITCSFHAQIRGLSARARARARAGRRVSLRVRIL